MKYLKVENPNDFYYIDVEGDGLEPTRLWCVVIKCKGTQQVWKFNNEDGRLYHEIWKFFSDRPNATWCGHNGVSFDGPVLAHFCGTDFRISNWVDTLVLSYLYNPSLIGGHSLAAYGEKLGFQKVVHDDWTKYSPEMLHRCEVDVELLEKVHDALLERMNRIGFSEFSCYIEHHIREVIDRQEQNGFYFHKDKAVDLLQVLSKRLAELDTPIRDLFPPELVLLKEYKRKFKKDGSFTKDYQSHLDNPDLLIKDLDDGYSTHIWEEFNIASSQQRLERLLRLGYVPTAKTKKGNPKIDEDSLLEYAKENDEPAIRCMAEWLVTKGRMTMIGGNPETDSPGWMGFLDEKTSRVHGHVLTCGAQSRRFRHFNPNLGNVPSPQNGAAYGEECRSLWGVTPGLDRALVGYDATGLETKVLLHFLNSLKANKLLLEGDVHTMNQIDLQSALDDLLRPGWGKVVRGGGGAKTAMYAVIFGCYPPRLESILRSPKGSGQTALDVIYKNVPGLEKAMEDARDEWDGRKGLIKCLDGGFVRCPNRSAALNYRVQPNGSILMKLVAIRLDQKLKERGLWHQKVVDVHDEGQHEADQKDADQIGQTATETITECGEELNFRIKMSGAYKVGQTWAETH